MRMPVPQSLHRLNRFFVSVTRNQPISFRIILSAKPEIPAFCAFRGRIHQRLKISSSGAANHFASLRVSRGDFNLRSFQLSGFKVSGFVPLGSFCKK
jgi:hypothetical protein